MNSIFLGMLKAAAFREEGLAGGLTWGWGYLRCSYRELGAELFSSSCLPQALVAAEASQKGDEDGWGG